MIKKSSNVISFKSVLLVVLIIIISVVLYYYYFVVVDNEVLYEKIEVNSQISDMSNNCDGLEGYEYNKCLVDNSACVDDDCFLNRAMVNFNESDCLKIGNETLRVGCSSNLARVSIYRDSIMYDNVSICNNFEIEEDIEGCYDNYYYGKRLNENNISYCENIVDLSFKEECLR